MAQRDHVPRRSILAAGVAAGTASLSGCSLLWELNDQPLEELTVYVYNETQESHRVNVRFHDQEGTTVYREAFELEPGERVSEKSGVSGGPEYQVSVRIDGGSAFEGTYQWGGCRVDRAEIYVESETKIHVRGTNSCD